MMEISRRRQMLHHIEGAGIPFCESPAGADEQSEKAPHFELRFKCNVNRREANLVGKRTIKLPISGPVREGARAA